VKAHKKAMRGLDDAQEVFASTTKALDPKLIHQWAKDEKHAMQVRGTAMKIFDVQLGKGMWRSSSTCIFLHGPLSIRMHAG
jgi:hypothetical protein